MTDLEQLAERCEKASGPCRELDADIWDALGLSPKYTSRSPLYGHWARLRGGEYHFVDDSAWGLHRKAPHYTASLDAAMTLVPDDMRDEIEITTLYRVARVGINLNHVPDDGPYYGSNQCNSIPLALCAAALRARAAK